MGVRTIAAVVCLYMASGAQGASPFHRAKPQAANAPSPQPPAVSSKTNSANTDSCNTDPSHTDSSNVLAISRRVKIYEDTGNGRILQYDPNNSGDEIMNIDADSAIVIEPQKDDCGQIFLNEVFMSATLNSSTSTDASGTSIEVTNYSELKNPATLGGQALASVRTTGGLFGFIMNLYRTINELNAVLDPLRLPASNPQILEPSVEATLMSEKPKVDSIVTVLSDPQSNFVNSQIAVKAFQIDTASMVAVAKSFQGAMNSYLGSQNKLEADAQINLLVMQQEIRKIKKVMDESADSVMHKEGCKLNQPSCVEKAWKDAVQTSTLVPGQIYLPKNKAADGDTIKLTVAVRSPGGDNSAGASKDFFFRVRKYHARMQTDPSFLLLRRVHDITDATGQLTRVNFAPSPGFTLGYVFYNRGIKAPDKTSPDKTNIPNYSLQHRFMSGLAPGIGLNVSFMNFANPTDYVNGKFQTTSASDIQVGTGPVLSLFANNVYVTYGWNLQTAGSRAYWGIGFNFLQIGKTIVGPVK